MANRLGVFSRGFGSQADCTAFSSPVDASRCPLARRSLDLHRKMSKAQFSHGAPVNRNEMRIGEPGIGEARQQATDGNIDGGSAKDIADAMVRAGAEGEDALRVA